MENNMLVKSSEDIEAIRNMSKHELVKYAEIKSKEILSLIKESCEKVADAKRDAEYAEAMKIPWFGRSKAKTDAVASALLRTNEAVAELANLQKNAITFTCVSVEFARVMHQTMARLMVAGFKDVYGCHRELDENTQQFAQHILDETEKFVKNQQAVECELSRQAESINIIAKIAEDNRKRLAEKDGVDQRREELIYRNRDSIRENKEKNVLQDKELERQAAKDEEHDKRLNDKDAKDVEHDRRLNEKDEKDKRHDERLDDKDAKDIQHDKRLDDLSIRVKKLESTKIPLWMKITVIISFVLSVISLFLSLAKY